MSKTLEASTSTEVRLSTLETSLHHFDGALKKIFSKIENIEVSVNSNNPRSIKEIGQLVGITFIMTSSLIGGVNYMINSANTQLVIKQERVLADIQQIDARCLELDKKHTTLSSGVNSIKVLANSNAEFVKWYTKKALKYKENSLEK